MTQISFTLNNGDAANTIYMPTSDPSVNQITVLMSSDTALTLTAGKPVEESKAAGSTGTLFYLHLENLGLTQSELNGLTVSMQDWTTKVFADTQVVCLTPEHDTPYGAGQMLTASIGNFKASKAPSGSSAQLYMNFYRATPVSSGGLPFTYNNIVTLQAPPSGKLDLHEALTVSLESSTVVQSTADYPQVENRLNLTFAPGSNPKTINAGPKTVFTVNFVYASDQYGYGALTTLPNAFKIGVNGGDGAAAWVITAPSQSSANPGWMLQPPAGQPILGSGATVEFLLSNILTTFEAGPTLMMVSYSNVPGYQDGAFSIVIYKEAHVYIHSLLAAPNPAVLDEGMATVYLSWNATGSRLTLMPGMIDVTGLKRYPTKIAKSTQFTLIAQGRSPSNYASSDIQVDIFPVINAIVASPQNVYYKDFPHDVLLDWSVNSNAEVALSTSIGSQVQYYPPNYTTGVNISQPQMFTIEPYDTGLPLFIERNEVISAFSLKQQTISLNATPLAVALSSVANICAVIQQGTGSVLLLETITGTPYGNPISAGSNPVALVFAPDGGRLFVANGGDSTLTVFNVTFSDSSNNYVFTQVTKVNLSGVPAALQVSADGTAIFVTSNNTNRNPGVLDVITSSNGVTYVVSNSLNFTGKVGRLTVLPSAAQIFVVSPATPSIYVVGYDSIHQSYQWVRTIAGFDPTDQPVDIAIAGQDSGTLLIACSGSNSLYAVSKETSKVSGKQKLQVGSNPTRVMVIESGAYAYVANSGDNTLSLISCFKGDGLCSVLESSLANGAAPTALTSSAGGSLIYVANGNASLSVWNNTTFTDDGVVTSATLTTSVTASLQYVVSWHNYNRTFNVPGKTATPGLSIYNLSTQTTALVNASTQYVSFEFWPDESQNIAIATKYGDNNLYVLETVGFTTVSSLPFSNSATCRAIATTISPFGNMIFVLTIDTGGVYKLVAISCAIKNNKYTIVSTVDLFTQPASSGHSLAAVSDGSSAFVTDSASQTLYIVTGGKAGYSLEGTTYNFVYAPSAMSCAPNDTELYVWMSQGSSGAFARFNIAARVLENFVLPNTVQFQFTAMAISPDGSRLYVADANFGGVRVFSTDAMQNVENISFPEASFPLGVAIAPDGSGLYTANTFSGNVSLGGQLAAVTRLGAPEFGDGGPYVGIFLRDYIGETPTSNAGTGWTSSPDIAPWGTSLMPDPSVLATNYNTDYAQNIALDHFNNVYVRGLNTNNGPQTSRIYFYWVISSIVQLPGDWSPYNFKFDNNLQNWLDITAQKLNDVAYSPAPLAWQPSSSSPHYCLVAWADNSNNPSPPDLSQWANFQTWQDVGNFIIAHPNMAWRNTNDVVVPGQFMNSQTRATGPLQGGTVTVGVIMQNIAIGSGTIQFTLVNSNGTISYNSPVHTIDTNTFSQTIQWPANAPSPVLTYTYTPTSGTLKGGEQITAFTSFLPPMTLKKQLLLRAPHALIDIARTRGSVQEMMLGTVKFKYTGG
jgi:DNA-binding beta-propeller fold protein YncE